MDMKNKWPLICRASLVIKMSRREIWSIISSPGNLENFHPFCESNDVSIWPGVGAKDEIRYLSGMILHRRFLIWEDLSGYSLMIGEDGGPESYVEWRLDDSAKGSTKVTISVHPYYLRNWPLLLSSAPYISYVRPKLNRYLKSVLAGLAHFSDTGDRVSKNQFGEHSWFS